jgi:hypothetical protein
MGESAEIRLKNRIPIKKCPFTNDEFQELFKKSEKY